MGSQDTQYGANHEKSERPASNEGLSRRSFLKIAGAASVAVGAGGGLGSLLAACGEESTSGNGAGETIKIGILGPMSDPSGQNVQRPAELLVKEFNDAGGIVGHQLELLGSIDDHWETAQAITGYETLIGQGANVILGGSDDNVESALLSRIARQPDVLYLSVFASTEAFMKNVAEDYENFKTYFMYPPTDEGMYWCCHEPMAMLREKHGFNRPYMLREDMVWTEGPETMFRKYGPEDDFEIAGVDVIPIDVEDLAPYFRNAREAGADMILAYISVFGEKLANQAYESKVPIPIIGHNGALNDYGFWARSHGAWGSMATTSNWGSLQKHNPEWRDFVIKWFNTYTDDPRTCMWLGEATYRAMHSYKDACERAGTIETEAVISELEKTYYPDAATCGGFYGEGEGPLPHSWCIPEDETQWFVENPERDGNWRSSHLQGSSQWQPADVAPADAFAFEGEPEDYGRLVTVWPPHLAGGEWVNPVEAEA